MITNKREIVLILGAGFSHDAGLPTMAQFGIDTKREFDDLDKSNNKQKSAYPILKNAGEIFKKFQDYCANAKRYIELDINNMEHIFCIAETMQAIGDENLKNIGLNISEVNTNIKLWLWKIYHRCPPVDDKEKADIYSDFFKVIKNYGAENIAVITTNYDLVFEYMAYSLGIKCCYPDIFKGTKQIIRPSQNRYISREANSLVVCKIHGSVNYFSDGQDLFVFDDVAKSDDRVGRSKITKNQNPRPAIFMLDAIWKIKRDFPSFEPEIIQPTYSKIRHTDWQKKIMYDTHEYIKNAERIYFIGYSFPESDGFIRSLFQSAFAHRKKAPIIYVVDPYADLKCDLGKRYRNYFAPISNCIKFMPMTFKDFVKNKEFEKSIAA